MKDNLKGVGIWGQRHCHYLKENKPGVMLLNGNLIPRMQGADEQADGIRFAGWLKMRFKPTRVLTYVN